MLKTITCIKRNSYVSQNSRVSEWEKDIQFCWGINIRHWEEQYVKEHRGLREHLAVRDYIIW